MGMDGFTMTLRVTSPGAIISRVVRSVLGRMWGNRRKGTWQLGINSGAGNLHGGTLGSD